MFPSFTVRKRGGDPVPGGLLQGRLASVAGGFAVDHRLGQHRRCYHHRCPECPPMLPPASLSMPATWRDLLEELAPVFARRSTHRLFVALACGMILADRSTVVAMAAAGGIAGKWRRACWFFSGAVWDVDELGLAVARLMVRSLLAGGEPVVVAVDGTFFKRWGRKVFQAGGRMTGQRRAGGRWRSGMSGWSR